MSQDTGFDSLRLARERIAQRAGLSSTDAELLLTGQDVETLIAQGQRLADMDSAARLAGSNVAPKEGISPSLDSRTDMSEFVADLFQRDDD